MIQTDLLTNECLRSSRGPYINRARRDLNETFLNATPAPFALPLDTALLTARIHVSSIAHYYIAMNVDVRVVVAKLEAFHHEVLPFRIGGV